MNAHVATVEREPQQQQQQQQLSNPYDMMGNRLNVDGQTVFNLMRNTLLKAKKNQEPTNEELMVFMSIANKYQLDPLTKEVTAFNSRGAIQPVVTVDGWLRIINSHPLFDGMEYHDQVDANGKLTAITCHIYRKDRRHATSVTEYMAECAQGTEPWKKWPARMLRHKATIQAARYAFGLSGICDPDEAERIRLAERAERGDEREVESDPSVVNVPALPYYPQDRFDANFGKWKEMILSGPRTPDEVIHSLGTRATLTDNQVAALKAIVEEAA